MADHQQFLAFDLRRGIQNREKIIAPRLHVNLSLLDPVVLDRMNEYHPCHSIQVAPCLIRTMEDLFGGQVTPEARRSHQIDEQC